MGIRVLASLICYLTNRKYLSVREKKKGKKEKGRNEKKRKKTKKKRRKRRKNEKGIKKKILLT